MFKHLSIVGKCADDTEVNYKGTVVFNGEGCAFDASTVTDERGVQHGLTLVNTGGLKFFHFWGTFKSELLEAFFSPEKEAIAKEFMAALKEAS